MHPSSRGLAPHRRDSVPARSPRPAASLPTPGLSPGALLWTAVLCGVSLAGLVLVGYAIVSGGRP